MENTTDLAEPADPRDIPHVLRRAAQKMRDDAAELRAAWQDRMAGEPWRMVADELERAAQRIANKL